MSNFHDDKAMMQSPETWPIWPRLPVKRANNGRLQLGCLVEWSLSKEKNVEPVVYHGSALETLNKEDRSEYESFDDLLADGWVID